MATVPKNDLEANGSNNRDSADTRTYDTHDNRTYQSTVLPASATDFDPEPHRRLFRQFANPAPLGLCGFALTTFVLSLVNVHARSVTIPNIVIGLALAYGGLAQFCAGMWEFASGNTFGALAFSSYGAFWLSFACIFIPFFNIAGAYPTNNPQELFNALGHYLICWFIFTLFLCVGTLRSSIAFFGLFFTLAMAFMMLAIGYYKGENVNFIKAGGWFGLLAALFAWYNAVAALWNPGNSFIRLPVGQFPWAERGTSHVGRRPRGEKNH